MRDIYNPNREISDKWISTVKGWIDTTGEVLFILRYLRAGGAKDYGLITSHESLMKLIDICPIGTDVIALYGNYLQLRGTVDEDFIIEAQRQIPNDVEYMFVELNPRSDDNPRLYGGFDIGHKMMRDDLENILGQSVAIGVCPNFIGEDSENMVSFSKGGIDGPR